MIYSFRERIRDLLECMKDGLYTIGLILFLALRCFGERVNSFITEFKEELS